jgi:hypothetical protein
MVDEVETINKNGINLFDPNNNSLLANINLLVKKPFNQIGQYAAAQALDDKLSIEPSLNSSVIIIINPPSLCCRLPQKRWY